MGKVILITGVSSGIGKKCAEYLSSIGHKVYGTVRKPQTDKLPYNVVQMDVTDKDSIQRIINEIENKEKRIDVLINNAGMAIGGALEEFLDEEIKIQFNTNFFGVIEMCKAVIPIMRSNGNGLIINISSITGLMGYPFQSIYAATKFAIEGMSETLRMELKSFGIKVVLINPGDFRTNFTANRKACVKLNNDSPYKEQYLKTLRVVEHDERHGTDPIKIAHKIAKIINKKSPKVRYIIGNLEQVLFARSRGILPSKWFVAILADHYKL